MPPADDASPSAPFANLPGTRPADAAGPAAPGALGLLLERYRAVRARSVALARPLSAEDQLAQAMPDASPTKWHLAHTTWFFETFVLADALAERIDYRQFDPAFGYLFNSYYEAVGARHPRPARGLLTRPSATEVLAYRAHVDAAMSRLAAEVVDEPARELIALGLAHEEQHQELILMDILSLFALSPLRPAYAADAPRPRAVGAPSRWVAFDGGITRIGARAGSGFVFDNETPRHLTLLQPYELASRLVTNGEWLAFMDDGGYRRAEFWLADGWSRVQAEGWTAPLYWRDEGGAWRLMALGGPAPLDLDAPVAHVSFFEAAAFAAWAGGRLPTEAEWEHAAETDPGAFAQLFGEVWQWTASAYSPHPGFAPAAGAVGEYNGKFMVGQMVLKGSACVTSPGHSRPSYRNFFYPHQRWMFAGVRLARDAAPPETAASSESAFRADVLDGLAAPRKRLPAKWFYDAAGSALFERICELPEYYPTRQETSLLANVATEIAVWIPDGATLVELGSGASLKTRLILDAAPQIAAYAPVDISETALAAAARAIARDYPALTVRPVLADFTLGWGEIEDVQALALVGFFPGSTIGNFTPGEAIDLLAGVRARLGPGGLFIVGVDLAKDADTLTAAYDDAAGVTAAFNLNLLARINRDLGGDFQLDAFAHRAVWNRPEGRIEMHLEALRSQSVTISGKTFEFVRGETIHTENAYKPSPEAFESLARRAGFGVARTWISQAPEMAVFLLQAA